MVWPRVRTGLDLLLARGFDLLRGRRIAVLAHPASVASNYAHIVDLLHDAKLDLRVIFGPEHGFGGAAQDMEPVEGGGSPTGGIPVVSLYGNREETLRPPADALADVDILVVDLQDVGSRYYTFTTTMRACMSACAVAKVDVLILDRPNPINGVTMEGPVMQDSFRSFVGDFIVPVRHALTMGEMARWAQQEGVDVDLKVLAMKGWRRSMWFDQTGLPWVLPSPNMPSLDTATVYPGSCLLEGTNLSEGRGTTRPFEIVGAPWLDGERWAKSLASVSGAVFRPLSFCPTFQKHAGCGCLGIQIHVTQREVFLPFLTGCLLLQSARRMAPSMFSWREQAYEFVTDRLAIDLLTGSPLVREFIEKDEDLIGLTKSWEMEIKEFTTRRKEILLYPENE